MENFDHEYYLAKLLAKEMSGTLSREEAEELERLKAVSPRLVMLQERLRHVENREERDRLLAELDIKGSWMKIEKICRGLERTRKMKLWVRWSAAAAVLVLSVGIGLFYFSREELTSSSIASNEVSAIQAGSSKAILVSELGQEIELSKDGEEEVLDLGNGLRAIRRGGIVEYLEGQDTVAANRKLNEILVPRGGEYELILPDGTHVWINSDSKLSFPSRFDHSKREVFLEGEAYFAVTKDAQKPFYVKLANQVQVQVLGTEFNVRAYSDMNVFETTLCTGKVDVSDGKSSMILSPSQQAVYHKVNGRLEKRKVNTYLYTAWKDGLFVFDNERLENILSTLSRWYNVNVFYENNAVKDYHFSGRLERYNDFEKVLKMIEKTTSISFEIKDRNVVVKQVVNK